MSVSSSSTIPRGTRARRDAALLCLLALFAGVLLKAYLGSTLGLIVCLVVAATIGIALLTDGRPDTSTRNPTTGLPDRADALRRLDAMMAQPHSKVRQSAVVVIAIEEDQAAQAAPLHLPVALRLAGALRKGDRIVHLGETELGAILGPSKGINARSVRAILDRIDDSLKQPFDAAGKLVVLRVALGACLQRDAPGPGPESWLEAAERAASLGRECGEPCVFWVARATPAHWLHAPADTAAEDLPPPRRRA